MKFVAGLTVAGILVALAYSVGLAQGLSVTDAQKEQMYSQYKGAKNNSGNSKYGNSNYGYE